MGSNFNIVNEIRPMLLDPPRNKKSLDRLPGAIMLHWRKLKTKSTNTSYHDN
jgi:hypothetical protein